MAFSKIKEFNIRDSHIIILGDCEIGFYKEKPAKFYNYFSKQLKLRNNIVILFEEITIIRNIG